MWNNRIDQPKPGYYWTRLVRDGPKIGARIWWDDTVPERPAVLCGSRNGMEVDPYHLWGYVADREISEAEYLKLIGELPSDDPDLDPTEAVNLNKLPPVW
ncbi:hypothetical protein KGP36_07440 [Patescibacteria group bacterium]|nr:hypothetical protein [Patescibacteria group bacterium]